MPLALTGGGDDAERLQKLARAEQEANEEINQFRAGLEATFRAESEKARAAAAVAAGGR